MQGPILGSSQSFRKTRRRLAYSRFVRGPLTRRTEIYDAEEVNLAELPDRSNFLAELDRVTEEIARELEPEADQDDS